MFSGFKTFGSAQRALNILTGKDWKLKGRHALTPRHLHAWLRGLPHESRLPGVRVIPPPSEQEALQVSELMSVSWGLRGRVAQYFSFLGLGVGLLIFMEISHESQALIFTLPLFPALDTPFFLQDISYFVSSKLAKIKFSRWLSKGF